MRAHHLADEGVGGLDLESLGAPAELRPRRRVAAADEVHPEGVGHCRREPVRRERQSLLLGGRRHDVERVGHPRGDDRVLDEGVGADHVDRLGALLRLETRQARARRAAARRSSPCRRSSRQPTARHRPGRAPASGPRGRRSTPRTRDHRTLSAVGWSGWSSFLSSFERVFGALLVGRERQAQDSPDVGSGQQRRCDALLLTLPPTVARPSQIVALLRCQSMVCSFFSCLSQVVGDSALPEQGVADLPESVQDDAVGVDEVRADLAGT